jgi:hypothetical protein
MVHSIEERNQTERPNEKWKPMLQEFLGGIRSIGRSSKFLGELLKMQRFVNMMGKTLIMQGTKNNRWQVG